MSVEARGSILRPLSRSLSGRAERGAIADKKSGRGFPSALYSVYVWDDQHLTRQDAISLYAVCFRDDGILQAGAVVSF